MSNLFSHCTQTSRSAQIGTMEAGKKLPNNIVSRLVSSSKNFSAGFFDEAVDDHRRDDGVGFGRRQTGFSYLNCSTSNV